MDTSPKGREIEWIEGNASDIISRGNQIHSLGEQMIGSAGILEAIHDGASGMKGLSLDKIREVVGDVFNDLRAAGKLYGPSGEAIRNYGSALAEVQTGLRGIIDDAEDYWHKYSSAQAHWNELDKKAHAPQTPPPAGQTGKTPEQTQLDHDLSSADTQRDHYKALFDAEGEKYDAKWDTWDEAFESAASKISDAMESGIHDHWNDNLAGFVEVALKVLAYVGLVLAVLALVIGGPIIAALATIVAILTLIGTIYQMTQHRADGVDLAWAIVGVIPFAKFAKFAEGGAVGAKAVGKGFVAADDFAEGWGQVRNGWSAARTAFNGGSGLAHFTGGASGLWSGVRSGFSTTVTGQNILARYMGLADAGKFADLGSSVASTRNLATAEVILGHVGEVNVKTTVANIVSMADLMSDDGPDVETWEKELASTR
ncbi:hypothetical protein WDJ51_06925 [Rathayibacter sp. YIM 133350]|uniref:hypothetical protein n=1 Tax=Rathayibacter sp. YIM 133350 TaxID=3131992 RepID=UPI00307DD468